MDRSLQQIDAADVRSTRQQRLADIRRMAEGRHGIGEVRQAVVKLCELLSEEVEHV